MSDNSPVTVPLPNKKRPVSVFETHVESSCKRQRCTKLHLDSFPVESAAVRPSKGLAMTHASFTYIHFKDALTSRKLYVLNTRTAPNQRVRSTASACRHWVKQYLVLEPRANFTDFFLYENHIARVHSDAVLLYDGGWRTHSTALMLNYLLEALGSEFSIVDDTFYLTSNVSNRKYSSCSC